jgi:hypothetical protein
MPYHSNLRDMGFETDGSILLIIRFGIGFTDEKIWKIIAYLKLVDQVRGEIS